MTIRTRRDNKGTTLWITTEAKEDVGKCRAGNTERGCCYGLAPRTVVCRIPDPCGHTEGTEGWGAKAEGIYIDSIL
jgi:hypothetical protein